jgi:hypothetical protein
LSKPRACPKANVRPHAEAVNRTWHAVAPADHTLSEVLWPGWLGAKVKDMRAGDDFVIRHELHHFIVRAYIMDVDIDAGMLAYVTTSIDDLRTLDAIAYDWADVTISREQGGWAISDRGTVLKGGFASEAKAAEWLAEKRASILAGKVPG